MLVDSRQVHVREIENGPTRKHRVGESVHLLSVETAKENRHEQRRNLIVGNVAGGVRIDQLAPFGIADSAAVALPLDDSRNDHSVSRGVCEQGATSCLLEKFMRLNVCTAVMLFAVSSTAFGQSAADEIAAGDRAYAALEEPAALEHYQKAVAAEPKNYEALWKASRSAIDYGIPQASADKRNAMIATGEQYARRAVEANPGDAAGHFGLTCVLGETSLTH